MLITQTSAQGTQPNFAKWTEANDTDARSTRWRCIVNVNETIEIKSLVSQGHKKHFMLAVASRQAIRR